MKNGLKIVTILLLAALPAVVSSQTVVVEYMKVSPDKESLYLQVEQEWKKVHQARLDDGLINGWNLFRNVFAGAKDPYQYITVTWYDDMSATVASYPDGFENRVMSQLDTVVFNQTAGSRILSHRDVSHSMVAAANNQGSKFIVINRMRPTPGNWDAYVETERELMKPVFEESIRQGHRTSWGLWDTWPYDEGQIRLVTVDGFDSLEQQAGENMAEIFAKVFPGKDMDEAMSEVMSLREHAVAEVWESVDSVWPEED